MCNDLEGSQTYAKQIINTKYSKSRAGKIANLKLYILDVIFHLFHLWDSIDNVEISIDLNHTKFSYFPFSNIPFFQFSIVSSRGPLLFVYIAFDENWGYSI